MNRLIVLITIIIFHNINCNVEWSNFIIKDGTILDMAYGGTNETIGLKEFKDLKKLCLVLVLIISSEGKK